MYSLRLSRHAIKDLDDLPDTIGQRTSAALEALAKSPRPPGCKRIKGAEDTYRIRVGDYRILYDVDDGESMVLILRVQHRKDAYRSL
ncbi:MAG: type II toxin-antitoxin system RelE/ParE family toxin [Dehalococcoidia bacterium]|nr:type II toxin-antitoxin system RelE/ParE family toxin [Dehalococcoidia bacterium]